MAQALLGQKRGIPGERRVYFRTHLGKSTALLSMALEQGFSILPVLTFWAWSSFAVGACPAHCRMLAACPVPTHQIPITSSPPAVTAGIAKCPLGGPNHPVQKLLLKNKKILREAESWEAVLCQNVTKAQPTLFPFRSIYHHLIDDILVLSPAPPTRWPSPQVE